MALKIYFCDGCNESIPLKDINENRITIDAGKIYCSKCAPKKPVRDATRSSLVVVGVLVALIGFGFGLVAFLLSQQLRDIQNDIRRLDQEFTTSRDHFEALKRDSVTSSDASRTTTTLLDGLESSKKELAAQAERIKMFEGLMRTEVDTAEKRLAEKTGAELVALARQFEKMGEDWRAQSASFEALKNAVASVESSIGQVRADFDAVKTRRGGANGGGGAESGPAEPELPDDSSRDLLATLKDSDPMRRFSAVMELARFRTPAVVTALEGMLQDPESYVRDGSVRTLRKINSPSSITAIIRSLRDDDFFVRASAREALKSMTTADIPFDPNADAAERERAVREWEGWWQLNHERLQKPPPPPPKPR
jgi:HEAT repeats